MSRPQACGFLVTVSAGSTLASMCCVESKFIHSAAHGYRIPVNPFATKFFLWFPMSAKAVLDHISAISNRIKNRHDTKLRTANAITTPYRSQFEAAARLRKNSKRAVPSLVATTSVVAKGLSQAKPSKHA